MNFLAKTIAWIIIGILIIGAIIFVSGAGLIIANKDNNNSYEEPPVKEAVLDLSKGDQWWEHGSETVLLIQPHKTISYNADCAKRGREALFNNSHVPFDLTHAYADYSGDGNRHLNVLIQFKTKNAIGEDHIRKFYCMYDFVTGKYDSSWEWEYDWPAVPHLSRYYGAKVIEHGDYK